MKCTSNFRHELIYIPHIAMYSKKLNAESYTYLLATCRASMAEKEKKKKSYACLNNPSRNCQNVVKMIVHINLSGFEMYARKY
jgi:hypothetical protein